MSTIDTSISARRTEKGEPGRDSFRGRVYTLLAEASEELDGRIVVGDAVAALFVFVRGLDGQPSKARLRSPQ